MSTMHLIAVPQMISVGAGTCAHVTQILNKMALRSPFIITDSFLAAGPLTSLTDPLDEAEIEYRIFSETIPDPTISTVEAALSALDGGQHDCVIAFGGGSPMDTAKMVAALAFDRRSIASLKSPAVTDHPGLPVIAIPTTAGTGSEATRFSIITDDKNDEKMLCAGMAFLPRAAIIDCELTLVKPPRLTADTGIDALTHAIEAYVSQRANAFSDAMAISAMKLIAPNLRTAYDEPENLAAREAMMIGAHHAGLAFSNASVALVHGMSRPIGAFFHVPHGLSNAMLLPKVTAWTAPFAQARYADCARAMALTDDSSGDQWAVASLIDELEKLNADLCVPKPAAYGINHKQYHDLIPVMAEQAIASGSPANNPRIPTHAEISKLYATCYE